VDQRQVRLVRGEHPPDDLGVDLVRLVRDIGRLVQVARPLARAHAHHRPLHLVVVAAAALAHESLAHLVPDLLRLDEHAVEVEDDGVGQRPWYSRSRYISACVDGPRSTVSTSPTTNVWSPT